MSRNSMTFIIRHFSVMYNSYNYNKPASHSNDAPDEASLIGLVQHLNKDELQDLLDNETKVLEMVCDNAQVNCLLP